MTAPLDALGDEGEALAHVEADFLDPDAPEQVVAQAVERVGRLDVLVERGITVNAVNPGPTDTGWAGPEEEAWVREHMPLGRWGTPEDAARLVAWLVSDEAAWVTGQVIDSEGGFRRHGGA